MNHSTRRLLSAGLFLVTLSILDGCAATPNLKGATHPVIEPRSTLRLFDGREGKPMQWGDLMDAIATVDVVIVGELHDDANGHQVEQAIVHDALERWPDVALSMEMLERNEQSIVDDYLADLIDRDKFMERTASTPWRKLVMDYFSREINRKTFTQKILHIGWPDWEFNYQPSIDAVKEGGGRVVAANAPFARYTKYVTSEGYEKFDELTPAQRALVEPAQVPESGKYRERFWDVMVGRAEGEEAASSDEDAEDSEGNDDEAVHMEFSDEDVLRSFHSQMMYDATMAESIARTLRDGAGKVIHFVGQFHCDFEGGTVMELRRRAPEASILVVSMQREDVDALRDDDVDRADIVIYTIPVEH